MNPFLLNFTMVRVVLANGDVIPASTVEDLRKAGIAEGAILAGVRERLAEMVDVSAEQLRNRITTPGAGQAMEYQEVQSQAAAALKAQASATAEKYPMLAASIGLDVDPQTGAPAADVLGVARSVTAAYQAWQAIGAEIRRARLAGKAAIGAATTIEAAIAAYDDVTWPSLA